MPDFQTFWPRVSLRSSRSYKRQSWPSEFAQSLRWIIRVVNPIAMRILSRCESYCDVNPIAMRNPIMMRIQSWFPIMMWFTIFATKVKMIENDWNYLKLVLEKTFLAVLHWKLFSVLFHRNRIAAAPQTFLGFSKLFYYWYISNQESKVDISISQLFLQLLNWRSPFAYYTIYSSFRLQSLNLT